MKSTQEILTNSRSDFCHQLYHNVTKQEISPKIEGYKELSYLTQIGPVVIISRLIVQAGPVCLHTKLNHLETVIWKLWYIPPCDLIFFAFEWVITRVSFKCVFKYPAWWSHYLRLNDLYPEWVFKNANSYLAALNNLSSEWVFKCLPKWPARIEVAFHQFFFSVDFQMCP